MTREIKFRAWNEQKKQMTYLEDEDVSEALHYQGFIGHAIMQFTGLHDKNGKEIYEGDVVKDADIEFPREVFWDNEMQGFSTKHKTYQTPLSNSSEEIIGNIYQHPNLLTP